MKIFTAGINQETNTFSPRPATLDDFERGYLLESAAIPETLAGTNSEINGFFEYLETLPDVQIVPGLAAWAVPSGKLLDSVLEELTGRLLDHLRRCLPVDGILLSLHGCLVSEQRQDCEGYILQAIRRVVGSGVPLVCTLDFHAVVTERMVECADILLSFRTYPHVDFQETGVRAARCLVDLIERKPVVEKLLQKIPLIVPVENCETSSGPAAEALAELTAMDQDRRVLAASLCFPHPWADVGEIGVSLFLYLEKNGDVGSYQKRLSDIAEFLWKEKDAFFQSFPDVETALDRIGGYRKPAILIDSGDITSAGALGDSTVVLRVLLNRNYPYAAVLPIVDGETVRRAISAGVGNTGVFEIGGAPRSDRTSYNQRVNIKAKIAQIRDEPVLVKGRSFAGFRLNMGRRVYLKTGNRIAVVVSEYTSLIHDPEVLRSMGIHPEAQEVIVQKSHKLFRAAYADIARSIITLDTPGYSDRNLTRLAYVNIPGNTFPINPGASLARDGRFILRHSIPKGNR